MFLDDVTIYVQAGTGGDGCESFLRRSDHKMVPDGGDGGKGGSVIFEADSNVNDLARFKYDKHFRAPSGGRGRRNHKTGKDGENLILRVPVGTTIINADENLLIRDLASPKDRVVCLEGGRPGRGNMHGKVVTKGKPGESFCVRLSLKLIADVFIVGEANAGKSLLLSKLTKAKVKDSTYPFSTRSPQLGVFETSRFRSICFCELPSLMEGSSNGKGLGARFLKHLARAKLVLLMLDPYKDFSVDLIKGYNILLNEVKLTYPEFSKLPHFAVVSKIDVPEIRTHLEKKKPDFDVPFFMISSKTGEGIEALTQSAEEVVFSDEE